MGALFPASHLIDSGFLASSLIIIIAPGPGVFFILGAGMARGCRHGLAAAAGVTLGCGPHVAAVTLGLAAIVKDYPLVFDVIRYLGGAYLVYLGVSLLRSSVGSASNEGQTAFGDIRKTIAAGALISLASPHLTLFFLAFFPSFVDPALDDTRGALCVVGALFLALAFATLSVLALSAALARGVFSKATGLERTANLAAAVAFLCIGVDAVSGGDLSAVLVG